MIALLWSVTLLGLLLWTAAAWGLWALLTWDPAWVARLHEQLATGPVGPWLERWLPDWSALLASLLGLLQSLLHGWAPWVGWLLGAVWAGGTLVALALAGLLHGAIRIGQRPAAAPRAA